MDGKVRGTSRRTFLSTFLRIQPPCRVSLLISALSYRSLGRAQSNRTVINNQGETNKKKKKTGVYVIRAFEILLSLLSSARRRRREFILFFSEFCCRRKKEEEEKGGKEKVEADGFLLVREDSRLALAANEHQFSSSSSFCVCDFSCKPCVSTGLTSTPLYEYGGRGTDNPPSLEDHFSLDRRSYQPKKKESRSFVFFEFNSPLKC